jgi:hypothetical protein
MFGVHLKPQATDAQIKTFLHDQLTQLSQRCDPPVTIKWGTMQTLMLACALALVVLGAAVAVSAIIALLG